MELTIEKMIYGGDGLARLPSSSPSERSRAVFVPYVLPGERVEAAIIEERPGFARARPHEILKASPHRTQPPCPYFGSCGGCHYQHANYDEQRRLKAEILRETLRRTSKFELPVELQVHSSPPFGYRNRTRFHIETKPEFAIGYFRHGSHELLPVRECPISSPLINQVLTQLWTVGSERKVPAEVAEVELFANAEDDRLLIELYLRTEVAGAGRLTAFAGELVRRAPQVVGIVGFCPVAQRRTRRSRNSKAQVTEDWDSNSRAVVLFGDTGIRYTVDNDSYCVSAGAFFQTNRFLAHLLVQVACGERRGSTALDLYSGVGLFTVPLARRFERVIAVESSPISVGDLKANVPANVKVSAQSAQAYLAGAVGRLKPDVIVADPPRAGLGPRVCESIVKLRPRELVYVSCDPATLARDLKQLTDSGLKIVETHLFDLFPQTFHIETCAVLRA
jgi:23S rRNA (uracil1939-C5)-methyltransferase